MIPLKDNTRTLHRPWVNWLLIAANIVVFLYEITLSQSQQSMLLYQYGAIPVHILHDQNWLTLVTAMFLHGGWLHIGGNMLYLWIFGDNVEDRLGHFGYLVFYFAGGILANFSHALMNPASTVPTIGASGAIAAVLGAYFISYPGALVNTIIPLGIFFTVASVPAVIFLFIWFAWQVLDVALAGGTAEVAFWAHIGGFLVGVAVMTYLNIRRRLRQ